MTWFPWRERCQICYGMYWEFRVPRKLRPYFRRYRVCSYECAGEITANKVETYLWTVERKSREQ